MKAEIVAIGTELLLGQVLDTNSQYLAEQLSLRGINVYFHTVVGDNRLRLKQTLMRAAERSDLVFCTGGIGPTQDDITKEVIAEICGKPLIYHEPTLEKLERHFRNSNRKLVESNKRMAWIVEGSTPFYNEVGQAVGLAVHYKQSHFVVMPGPPRELKGMFAGKIASWLKTVLKSEEIIYSKLLKFAGIGESSLENQLLDLIDQQTDPTLAPYANTGEVAIRLSTKAENEEQAMRKIMPVENEIRKRVGEYLYADEDLSLEQLVVQMMKDKGVTLSAAESCTGGLFSQYITAVEGSSEVFAGGIICYSNKVKNQVLHIPEELLAGVDAPGAVSAETAERLAESVMNLTGTDYGVSFTGVAGPGQMEGKPVGLIYIGLAQRERQTVSFELFLSSGRETIRLNAVKRALYELWRRLKENG